MSARYLHWSRCLPEVGAGIIGGEPDSSASADDGTALGWERLQRRITDLRRELQAAEEAATIANLAINTKALHCYTRAEIAAAMAQGKKA